MRSMLPFSIAVSTFGFFLIAAFAIHVDGSVEAVALRKPLVGSIFVAVCCVGIVLSVSPRKCPEPLGHKKRIETAASSSQTSNMLVTTKGHHYNCGKFSAHTIRIGGHEFCAACAGLLVGGVAALLGAVLYFFVGWESQQIGLPIVLVGAIAMVFGFLQLEFRGFARLILNTLFVIGAYLILVGMDQLTESLFIDLFSNVLIVFWLFTRILLSQWDHWRTCKKCLTPCEIRSKRKMGSISSAHSVQCTDHNQYSKDYYCERPHVHSLFDYSSLL